VLEDRPLGRKARGALLCTAGLLVGVQAAPVQAGSSEGRLLVTARVVNRCTIELPATLPRSYRALPHSWRRWVLHSCDHPVRPRLTLGRLNRDSQWPVVETTRDGDHYVVTITY
jgi:hypothetical protein